MDALSGILKIGRRRQVFAFDPKIELLLQGRDDHVKIRIISENFKETEKNYVEPVKREDLTVVMTDEEKKKLEIAKEEICMVCKQIVLPNDMVVENNKPMHKSCFKCGYCGYLLNNTDFASLEGNYYCIPHYIELFKVNADYVTGFNHQKIHKEHQIDHKE